MPIEILMPALSPTMEEGTLSKWLVKEGDEVASGDVIAEIETDKATMEVEAVDEGVIGKILVASGSEGVKVNATIALLLEEGEDESALEGAGSSRGNAGPAPKPSADAKPSKASSEKPSARTQSQAASADANGRIKASPLAKRIAEMKGIDLSALAGSGPGGRIVKRDVEAAEPGAAPAQPQSGAAQALVPSQAQQIAPGVRHPLDMGIREGSYDLVPLDGMKKTIAKRMTESFRDVPHFPLTIDIDLDVVLAQRKRLNARLEKEGIKISVNDFCIRAAALALREVPESNASYSPDGIMMHHHADVAVAVAIDGGLITPIIWEAETKGLKQISEEMADLAERARARKLMPEEYTGGTFSLSNLGMFGIKSFGSIINEPHGMILSIGAGEQRPVVKYGALAAATIMSVTVTCDHRVVDGATGARFLAAFKRFLEDPETMLL
ncbi:MAG: pyruvate dehydrogenase complex dihydrolipoamide acetyltransferase [Maricaulaceae bacterium]|jgi:pyruvate dehydrogenase E2 component (dihydrolipoamide acetyltransferase)